MTATQPALFVTFIYARDSENEEQNGAADPSSVRTRLISHLARPAAEGGLALSRYAAGEWRNSQQQTWARRFLHPELDDVEFLQVALNAAEGTGEAVKGWIIAWETLERSLKEMPAAVQEALIGRTLVYQAVLPAENDAQTASRALLAQNCLRASNGHVAQRALASSQVAGGHLWLLATPMGAAQESIYLALGAVETQDALNLGVLFGPRAALIWPDAVAHKAYFMSRDYLASRTRQRFRQASKELMAKTLAILQANNLADASILDDLSDRVAKLTIVMAELRRLHSGLEIHQTNYERSLEGSAFDSNGAVTAYHRQQIENQLIRIDHDLKDAHAALEAANIAIRTLRAKYEQLQAEEAKKQTFAMQKRAQEEQLRATEQAHAEMRTQDMLAMLALIIAVSQTIASDLELMGWRFFAFIILLMGASLFVRWREIKRHEQLRRSSTASQITTTTPDQIADSTSPHGHR